MVDRAPTTHGDNKVMELGAALAVGAVLILTTVFLSYLGLKGADDTPLNGGTQAAGTTQSNTTITTDPATDIYPAAPACDNFTIEAKIRVPLIGGQLPAAQRSTQDTIDTCEFQLRKGSWLTVVTTWFPAEGDLPGYQRAADALVSSGGSEIGAPRIGTAARLLPCVENACPLVFNHHNVLVRIDLTIGDKKLQNAYQQALFRLAGDFAEANLR